MSRSEPTELDQALDLLAARTPQVGPARHAAVRRRLVRSTSSAKLSLASWGMLAVTSLIVPFDWSGIETSEAPRGAHLGAGGGKGSTLVAETSVPASEMAFVPTSSAGLAAVPASETAFVPTSSAGLAAVPASEMTFVPTASAGSPAPRVSAAKKSRMREKDRLRRSRRRSRPEPDFDAGALMQKADRARRAGAWSRAERMYGTVADHTKAGSFLEEALLRRAEMLVRLRRFERARTVLAEAHRRVTQPLLLPERKALEASMESRNGVSPPR